MRIRSLFVIVAVSLVAGCSSDNSAGDVPASTSALTSATAVPTTTTVTATSVTSSSMITTTSTTTTSTVPAPTDPCARIAFDVAARDADVTQVVVVRVSSTTDTVATLALAERTADGWRCSSEYRARVGRAGVRPLIDRRSGDGTTPAGVFPLGVMTAWDGEQFSFFGNSADPGVTAGPYRAVRAGDCFGATPGDPAYWHLVQRAQSDCSGDDEYLAKYTGAYEHAALIGANMEPSVSGDAPAETPYAAAIFLHRMSYDSAGSSKPTSGCVSLAHDDLVNVLRWMHPDVQFAIGTEEWLLAGDW